MCVMPIPAPRTALKAFMWYEDHTFESKLFTFNILDRVAAAMHLPAA